MKKSKKYYYNNHLFDSNWNNIKNTWKGIKYILTINKNNLTILLQTQLKCQVHSTFTSIVVEKLNILTNTF